MLQPELYYVGETPWVPGSKLPVVVHRGALTHCENEDAMKEALEANGGWKKGGAWNAWFKAHFHPNVHECYGVVQGTSELSLGRSPLDPPSKGMLLKVNRGDVVILPAGVSHCSSTASSDYRFVVLFPTGEPRWISVWFDQPTEGTPDYRRRCQMVPLPSHDPLYGEGMGLVETWRKVISEGK
ncbi:hypothetical protein F4677DRAFT_421889 [Hypoxylon crocopeplum]|nr:hypothetical protein F4677DRAFT_421889 [Hypoxylon crocopeplum]